MLSTKTRCMLTPSVRAASPRASRLDATSTSCTDVTPRPPRSAGTGAARYPLRLITARLSKGKVASRSCPAARSPISFASASARATSRAPGSVLAVSSRYISGSFRLSVRGGGTSRSRGRGRGVGRRRRGGAPCARARRRRCDRPRRPRRRRRSRGARARCEIAGLALGRSAGSTSASRNFAAPPTAPYSATVYLVTREDADAERARRRDRPGTHRARAEGHEHRRRLCGHRRERSHGHAPRPLHVAAGDEDDAACERGHRSGVLGACGLRARRGGGLGSHRGLLSGARGR